MLSAASPPIFFHSTKPSPWREVQVLYRRICVLDATGKTAEADTLRIQKLEPAVKALRETSAGPEDPQLEAMFAAEEERVASAQVLAEILLPLLTTVAPGATTQPRFFSAPPSPTPAYGLVENFTSEPSPRPNPGGTPSPLLPGIADFIDEMLTQDRTPAGTQSPRRSA